MVAIAAKEAEAFLRGRWAEFPIILIYGPDEGLVSERAGSIALATAGGDPENVLRLDGDEVAADPLRLADEANAISMFGGMRAIRVKAGARGLAPGLEPLLGIPPVDARIIIEAGDIKGAHPLRALLEKSRSAAVLPCYLDDERAVGRLLDGMLAEDGLAIDADAKATLLASLGLDRRLSRLEIEKLILYCAGQKRIGLADVEAVVTDAAALSMDAAVDAAFLGRLDTIETEAGRLFADGVDPGVLLGFALRHALLLRTIVRESGGDGRTGGSAKSIRVSWKRETAVSLQAQKWTEARLERAVQIIGDAVLATRRQPRLGEAIAVRALWSLALAVARR